MLCSTPRFVIQFCLLRLPLRRDCLSRLFSLCLSSASSSSICTPPPGPVASDTTAEQVQHLMLDAQVEAFMPPPGQDVYAQKVASAGSCRCPSVSLASSSDSSSSLMSVSLASSSDSSSSLMSMSLGSSSDSNSSLMSVSLASSSDSSL